jgi:putative transposase
MPYWQLFYHIIWATKNREPFITSDIEPTIHHLIRTKAIGLGAMVFALNGWTDHVHIVAAVPPGISLSIFIGQIKGVASTKFNKSGNANRPLYWQDEYSVFSFDRRRLPGYIQYVEMQKEHHQQNTEIMVLERTDGAGGRVLKEGMTTYDIGYWLDEFKDYE